MRQPGPLYLYIGRTADESCTIGSVEFEVPDDTKERVAAIAIYGTTDLDQAERWRSALAAGVLPNCSADPPIVDPEQLKARCDEISLDSLQ
jgi:hypothetical protein